LRRNIRPEIDFDASKKLKTIMTVGYETIVRACMRIERACDCVHDGNASNAVATIVAVATGTIGVGI
jgi:hypothetical protein